MNENLEKLYADIKKAQGALETFRANCKHEISSMDWYSWRVGALEYTRLCNNCKAVVSPMPGDDKLKEEAKFETTSGIQYQSNVFENG